MKKFMLIFSFITAMSSLAGAPPPGGDSCQNGVLICNNTCVAPGSPGYDDQYINVCHNTNWNGVGTLTSPQLPAACSVPPGGGTINCAGANCIQAAAAVTKVKGKTSSSTPALPYVKYVRGNADKLECHLVYDGACSIKVVPNGMCKKASAMIPPKTQAPANNNINI